MESKGYKWQKIWSKIKSTVIKAVLCGHQEISESYQKNVESVYNCYKLFGIDIFLDDKLKPWLLELNNFPSLCTPLLDRHVNEPMIAEMFNIVGFQITNKMNKTQKENIRKKYGIEGPIEFDSRLYQTSRTKEEELKEQKYNDSAMQRDYNKMVEEDELTGGDVRRIIKAEDELAQTEGFIRLLPSNQSIRYLEYLASPSYSDRLLAAWEMRYGEEKDRGRDILARLCMKGVQYQ